MYLLGRSPDLSSDKLLKVADSIVRIALDTDFLTETVVANHVSEMAQVIKAKGR
jgi:hypothetical protein